MFEQTIYTVLFARYSQDGQSVEWNEETVKTLSLKDGKIDKVVTEGDKEIVIDNVTSFARRATGMFDKVGAMIFGGDIVKFMHQHKNEEEKEIVVPILWINGAYVAVIPGIEELVYLTQQNVMEMEKVGDVYRHGKVLETPIDEAIFAVEQQQEGEQL